MSTIESLPDELLEMVLMWADQLDRTRAARVGVRWRSLARRALNLSPVLTSIEQTKRWIASVKETGARPRCLTMTPEMFRGHEMKVFLDIVLRDAFEWCEGLHTLHLGDISALQWHILDAPTLRDLKELHITQCHYATTYPFPPIIATLPFRLRALTMDLHDFTTDEHRRFLVALLPSFATLTSLSLPSCKRHRPAQSHRAHHTLSSVFPSFPTTPIRHLALTLDSFHPIDDLSPLLAACPLLESLELNLRYNAAPWTPESVGEKLAAFSTMLPGPPTVKRLMLLNVEQCHLAYIAETIETENLSALAHLELRMPAKGNALRGALPWGLEDLKSALEDGWEERGITISLS
ncbi:hypothetical protein RQP46_007050 [Phenoliferia psychrophenolica]